MYKPVPQVHSSNEGEDSESELFNSSTLNFDEKSPQYGMQEQERLFEHFRYDCHFFSLHRSFRWCCSPANGKTFHVSGEEDRSSIINSELCGFHHPLLVDSTL
jgi:hypothetical protein